MTAEGTDPFSSRRRTDDGIILDPTRTAVLVVDMLNDFCSPGGLMTLPGAEKLYPAQRAVLDAARSCRAAVVYVNDNHRSGMRGDREFVKRDPHCLEHTWGSEVVADLAPLAGDHIVIKRRFSGFFQTDLDLTLKDLDVNSVVVMGVVTNICVRSTVHDAFFNGYRVAVPADCCAATGPREQASSLYDIGTHFGTVTHAGAVVGALRDGVALLNDVDATLDS